ncbi:MAG: hypothetical protein STHCBS139747_005493 [Sporothrix thermara]
MQLGPYDGRKKLSRCVACAASHLKRSRLSSFTPTYWLAADDATAAFYLQHFYAFVRRNDFAGKAAAVQQDLQHLGGLGPATYLRDAMLAIGAMHAANMGRLSGAGYGRQRREALEYYAAAVSGLSRALATTDGSVPPDADLRDAVLWTTLFLGFYELMSESPGQGWQLHMVHGTARALRASGAASCRRGRARTFFLQARVFEVFRAIVCSDATFLTEPEWTKLLEEMWVGEGDAAGVSRRRSQQEQDHHSSDSQPWHPLDALLDLIALCTKLRFRIRGFLAQCQSGLLAEDAIAAEGCAIGDTARSLRRALERWRDVHHDGFFSEFPGGPPGATQSAITAITAITPPPDPPLLLGHIFCAAANAYLSGIFDYELDQWDGIGISVPTLTVDALQQHVDAILRYAAPALASTNISPVLLLFPLRIAGARSRYPHQRAEVLRLLGQVAQMYAAADFYATHLQRLWGRLDADEAAMARARAEARRARASGRTYVPAGVTVPVIIRPRT